MASYQCLQSFTIVASCSCRSSQNQCLFENFHFSLQIQKWMHCTLPSSCFLHNKFNLYAKLETKQDKAKHIIANEEKRIIIVCAQKNHVYTICTIFPANRCVFSRSFNEKHDLNRSFYCCCCGCCCSQTNSNWNELSKFFINMFLFLCVFEISFRWPISCNILFYFTTVIQMKLFLGLNEH